MGTLIVGAILILIVGLIIRGIVRDKKSGKSSCGGDCSHCIVIFIDYRFRLGVYESLMQNSSHMSGNRN